MHVEQPPSCTSMGLGLTHQRLNLECALKLAELTGRKLLPYKPMESEAHTHYEVVRKRLPELKQEVQMGKTHGELLQ